MTIKGLSTLLKEVPECVFKAPLSTYSGYAITIDAGLLLYSKGASAYSEQVDKTNVLVEKVDESKVMNMFYLRVFEFFSTFYRHGVEPIVIFDGGVPVAKKQQAGYTRGVARGKVQAKMEDLERRLSTMDRLEMDDRFLEEKRKLMKQLPPYFGTWGENLMTLCNSFGILYAQSTEESDRLCASLVRDGVCIGAFTTDYDVLIHGCHLMFKGFAHCYDPVTGSSTGLEGVSLNHFLRGKSLSYSMLVDMAITMGCDYNIKDKSEKVKLIGPVKAYNLITEHKIIERFPPIKEWKALNHPVCRNIFYPLPSTKLMAKTNFKIEDGLPKLLSEPRIHDNIRVIISSMGISPDVMDRLIIQLNTCFETCGKPTKFFKPYDPFDFDFSTKVEMSTPSIMIGEVPKILGVPTEVIVKKTEADFLFE